MREDCVLLLYFFIVFLCLSPRIEVPQNKIKKLGQELIALERLVEEFEHCIGQQKDQLKYLKVSWRPEVCLANVSVSMLLSRLCCHP